MLCFCIFFFIFFFFFFQAEDGIRDTSVTGVQTCALPICPRPASGAGRNASHTRASRACCATRHALHALRRSERKLRHARWLSPKPIPQPRPRTEFICCIGGGRSEERRVGKDEGGQR